MTVALLSSLLSRPIPRYPVDPTDRSAFTHTEGNSGACAAPDMTVSFDRWRTTSRRVSTPERPAVGSLPDRCRMPAVDLPTGVADIERFNGLRWSIAAP